MPSWYSNTNRRRLDRREDLRWNGPCDAFPDGVPAVYFLAFTGWLTYRANMTTKWDRT